MDDPLTCRICLSSESSGPNDRIISPCRCKGTMKYVHLECLNLWRLKSKNSNSYYTCDQCGFKYNLKRTQIAGWIRWKGTVVAVSVGLVIAMVFLGGFAAKVVMRVIPDLQYEMDDIVAELGVFSPESLSFFRVDALHFIYGSFLLSIFASFSLILNLVLSPWNNRYRRRGGGLELVMIGVVLYGMGKVCWGVYSLVEERAGRWLGMLEEKVLNEDETA